MFRFSLACLAALCVLAPLGCSNAPQNGGGGTVRIAYFPNVTHAPAIIGVQSGAFQKAVGDQITVVPRVFSSGPSEMEALLAGEVDIAYVGASPAINAYVRSQGAVKIVCGDASGGAVLVARQGANITKPEDIAKKRIGTTQKGSTQDVALRYYVTQILHETLSEDGGQTQIISTDAPQIAALFTQKQCDAAWIQEPWGTRLIRQNAVLVLDERDLWPARRYATTVVVVRTAFLAAHPDIVQKIVAAHAQACGFIKAHKGETVQTVGGEIKRLTGRGLSPDIIKEGLSRIDFGVNPYPETLQTQANHAFALGFLGRKTPDLSGLLVPGMAKNAKGAAR